MAFPDGLKLLSAPLVQYGQATTEHLRQLVTGPDVGPVHQAGQQREPLRLADLAQIGGVEHPGFGGEVCGLRRGDAGEPRPCLAGRVERLEVADVLLEPRQRGPARWALQLVEAAAAGGCIDVQHAEEQRFAGTADPVLNGEEEAVVHLGP